MVQLTRLATISQYHRLRGLAPPPHPLLSVIDVSEAAPPSQEVPQRLLFDFFVIALKSVTSGSLRYGQQRFDFDSGMLGFSAPGQLIEVEAAPGMELAQTGWLVLVHPDFLWHTPLAKTIRQYDFFDYALHEALFLSEQEKATITTLIGLIRQESLPVLDPFTRPILVAHLDALLAHCNRFYQRQFLTRKITNHQVLDHLNHFLRAYFEGEATLRQELPTVAAVAEHLHVSPRYLARLVSALTGLNTRQYIQAKLVEKAKELLSTTSMSVSEVAYALGFAQLQSFSKLFKAKTNISPVAFRQSFK